MSRTIKVVEIKGKQFDASSGEPIKRPRPTHSKSSKKINVVFHDSAHDTKSVRVMHHRKEASRTLMRQVVKKPAATSRNPIHKTAHKSNTFNLEPDPQRIHRARQAVKHHAVSRFGRPEEAKPGADKFTKTVADVPVRPEPVPAPPEHHAPIQAFSHHQQHHDHNHMFQQVIDRADSHRQPKHKRPPRRHRAAHKIGVSPGIFSFSAAALLLVLLIGFIAYQNVTDIGIRMASARSGVQAKFPQAQPSGFGLAGPIQYQPGRVSLNFQSRSDNRGFRLHQRASSWDEETLVDNYLESGHTYVLARQSDGKNVYIYDDHNATWIKDGIWYQVEGDSSLNSNQLLNLAAGL